jgi:aminoglycoside phosphotransferase (APT) family kinase protein
MDDRQPVEIGLVRDLIDEQFSQWSPLPLELTEPQGWDNSSFRLGQDMLVRLPTASRYVAQVDKEQRWLPVLAAGLRLPIPEPIARGAPSALFPRPWSIYRWIDGETADRRNVTDLAAFAGDLADFLIALQRMDTTNGPLPGIHNFHRGGSLNIYDQEARDSIALLGQRIDQGRALALWDIALASTCSGPGVWVHGDVAPTNMLLTEGRLSAVLDFGSCAVGDPACDLVMAWTFLDRTSRQRFKARMNVDAGTWNRAAAWALWKAMLIMLAGAQEPPGQVPAERVISALLWGT